MTIDGDDEVYVAGRTTSDSGLVLAGQIAVPQDSPPGGRDGFVYKVDAAGSPVWATYLGGSGADQVNGVASDPKGNLALAGKTTSTSGFPFKNAYQATKRSTVQSVFAARLVTCTAAP